MLVWLEVMSEAGDAFIASKLSELPEDLVTLALHKHVLVLNLEELALSMQAADEVDARQLDKALESCLYEELGDGLFVTGFLGGNSNGTTGDFSLGAQGFLVRGGKLAEPVGEMNVSGNHLELWKHLAAVGDDPYPWSASRTPTLVFEGVQVAGT